MDAGGGTRTPKGQGPPAPKTDASANSATPATARRTAAGPSLFASITGMCGKERAQIVRSRLMAAVQTLPRSTTVTYPNRDTPASRTARNGVVAALVVSAMLILAVTVGGWSKLQGMTPLDFAWSLAYLVIAFYVGTRWARGLLPIAAALAFLLLIVSLIAGLGGAGTSWFDRSGGGYAGARTLFGAAGLNPNALGLLTLALAPVQALLLAFATRGFSQKWNVEVAAPTGEVRPRRGRS